MFTGIIETLGTIAQELKKTLTICMLQCRVPLLPNLKLTKAFRTNGVCLTVVSINGDSYTVTAIRETIEKTNLRRMEKWRRRVNIERAMKLGDRLDGHIVQGHVDQIGTICQSIDRSQWKLVFYFRIRFGT